MTPQKQCPRCQTISLIDAKFCTQCGHQFTTQFNQNQTQLVAAQISSPPPIINRKHLMIMLMILLGIIVLPVLAMHIYNSIQTYRFTSQFPKGCAGKFVENTTLDAECTLAGSDVAGIAFSEFNLGGDWYRSVACKLLVVNDTKEWNGAWVRVTLFDSAFQRISDNDVANFTQLELAPGESKSVQDWIGWFDRREPRIPAYYAISPLTSENSSPPHSSR